MCQNWSIFPWTDIWNTHLRLAVIYHTTAWVSSALLAVCYGSSLQRGWIPLTKGQWCKRVTCYDLIVVNEISYTIRPLNDPWRSNDIKLLYQFDVSLNITLIKPQACHWKYTYANIWCLRLHEHGPHSVGDIPADDIFKCISLKEMSDSWWLFNESLFSTIR